MHPEILLMCIPWLLISASTSHIMKQLDRIFSLTFDVVERMPQHWIKQRVPKRIIATLLKLSSVLVRRLSKLRKDRLFLRTLKLIKSWSRMLKKNWASDKSGKDPAWMLYDQKSHLYPDCLGKFDCPKNENWSGINRISRLGPDEWTILNNTKSLKEEKRHELGTAKDTLNKNKIADKIGKSEEDGSAAGEDDDYEYVFKLGKKKNQGNKSTESSMHVPDISRDVTSLNKIDKGPKEDAQKRKKIVQVRGREEAQTEIK